MPHFSSWHWDKNKVFVKLLGPCLFFKIRQPEPFDICKVASMLNAKRRTCLILSLSRLLFVPSSSLKFWKWRIGKGCLYSSSCFYFVISKTHLSYISLSVVARWMGNGGIPQPLKKCSLAKTIVAWLLTFWHAIYLHRPMVCQSHGWSRTTWTWLRSEQYS